MFAELKVNPNNGLGDVYDKIKGHAAEAEVIADIEKQYETRPGNQISQFFLKNVNWQNPSDKIIPNLGLHDFFCPIKQNDVMVCKNKKSQFSK